MERAARLLAGVAVLCCLAAPLAADPGEADRLLNRGFPDRDYSAAPIKLVVAGHHCVLAAAAWRFDPDGTATLTDAAVVRVTAAGDREVVEVAAGKSARVTFDRPVRKAEELGKSQIVSVETSDGRVIRLVPK
jgi:hypothetical protein